MLGLELEPDTVENQAMLKAGQRILAPATTVVDKTPAGLYSARVAESLALLIRLS